MSKKPEAKHISSCFKGMNKLPLQKRAMIFSLLVEGMSMRAISRTAGVSINTVTKLLVDAGEACAAYHHEAVRGVKAKRVQCDEIWSFCYAKQKNVKTVTATSEEVGDVWTWTGIDADSKLVVSYLVGGRDAEYANVFMDDVATRLASRVQITTDGHGAYLEAVDGAFGANVDHAQLAKIYGAAPDSTKGRYSPAECTGIIMRDVNGTPDKAQVSTSYAERQNLTMRMSMRRFTQLTNGFSKKLDNHIHMLSLYFVHYNFCRTHKSLRTSPTMAAGVSNTLRDLEWICSLIDARAPKPGRCGLYDKAAQISN